MTENVSLQEIKKKMMKFSVFMSMTTSFIPKEDDYVTD